MESKPIRVDPEQLKQAAEAIDRTAERLRAMSDEAAAAAMDAPSYDGEFGPRVRAMGFELQAEIRSRADRLQQLSEDLATIAAKFEEADAQSHAGFAGLFGTFRDWLSQLGLAPDHPSASSAIDRIRARLGSTAPPTPTPTPTPTSSSTPSPTPTPTPPSAPTVPTGPMYWGGLSEADLAYYQQHQGNRNDCAEFAIAASLNLMYGGNVRGRDVGDAADQIPWLLPWGGLRMWPDGPTSPQQQVNIVNGIASQGGFDFEATATKATPEDLIDHLSDPNSAVVVTIGWGMNDPPQIARTSDLKTQAGADTIFNGHAMLLAAYDPTHMDAHGDPAPWGFINSWENGGPQLFWMPDDDFREAFAYDIFMMGSNNAVVISESSPALPSLGNQPMATPTPSPSSTPSGTPSPSPTTTPNP